MQERPRSGDLVALDPNECVDLLQAAPWVRVAFLVNGEPTILPVNHLVHDGAIYFRTAPGSKLGSAAAGSTVAVEADGGDVESRIGWSVVVHGHAAIVTDDHVEQSLFEQPFEPWAVPGDRTFWVRVDVERISGRRIVRS